MSEVTNIAVATSLATSSPAAPPAAATNQTNVVTHAAMELDPDDNVTDDGVSEVTSLTSSTTSVAESILNYRLENGRTYHAYKEGKYIYPNDDREVNRLDLQHNMFVRSFDNRLALAPPNDPGAKVGRVLDCRTGSGIWAIEFAEDHPESEVIGVDLSATVPAFTPPNVKFEVDDVEEPWIYSQKFDYIHSRMMTSSIGDWRTYLQRCYDNLNPGGYLELIEVDGTGYSTNDSLNKESATERCLDLWRQAAEILGHPFQDIRLFKDIMLEIGFEDIHVREEKWPSNPWPKDPKYKELGAWNFENFSANIEGFIMAPLTRALNWTKEECLVLAMEVRKEMRDPKVHYWMTIMSIYGRKPENKEE